MGSETFGGPPCLKGPYPVKSFFCKHFLLSVSLTVSHISLSVPLKPYALALQSPASFTATPLFSAFFVLIRPRSAGIACDTLFSLLTRHVTKTLFPCLLCMYVYLSCVFFSMHYYFFEFELII